MKKYYTILAIFLFFSFTIAKSQSGLYLRTQFWSGGSLDVSWLYFNQSKKIVRNPIYGVNPLQLDKEVAENKSNVGTYIISGNKMTIDWADGKKQTINIEFKNNDLSGFDGGVCSKAKPFTFKYFSNKTYSGTAIYGSVGRSLTFTFGSNGQFTNKRLGSISGSGNTSGAAASMSEETGIYQINGNTILFKYANGKEWRVIAQPYDLGNEEILINDQLFRQKM